MNQPNPVNQSQTPPDSSTVSTLEGLNQSVAVKDGPKERKGSNNLGPAITAERKAKFLVLFRQAPYQTLCAEKVGITHASVTAWKKDDPEFAREFEEIKAGFKLTLSDRALQVVHDRMDVEGKEWLAVKALEVYNDDWKGSKGQQQAVSVNITTSIPNPHADTVLDNATTVEHEEQGVSPTDGGMSHQVDTDR